MSRLGTSNTTHHSSILVPHPNTPTRTAWAGIATICLKELCFSQIDSDSGNFEAFSKYCHTCLACGGCTKGSDTPRTKGLCGLAGDDTLTLGFLT